MRNHLMLDFETLATTSDASVVSLGAVLFNREKLIDQKYYVFEREHQKALGRFEDPETIAWWEKQGDDAKAVFGDCVKQGINLDVFAPAFRDFVAPVSGSVLVWANGANFDIPIVEHILKSQKVERPWKFWNTRCYRSLKSWHPTIEKEIPPPKIKHHALEDAMFQARAVACHLAKHPEMDR